MKNQFREKAYEICQRAYEKRLNVPSIQRNIYSNQVVVLCFFVLFFFCPGLKGWTISIVARKWRNRTFFIVGVKIFRGQFVVSVKI